MSNNTLSNNTSSNNTFESSEVAALATSMIQFFNLAFRSPNIILNLDKTLSCSELMVMYIIYVRRLSLGYWVCSQLNHISVVISLRIPTEIVHNLDNYTSEVELQAARHVFHHLKTLVYDPLLDIPT